ncbi:hypothetical protein [Propionicicella superfundia]|uniref:hypothetical protein n=1 Tax=Propionicicella superfundia TaxID=348582 RepID=UPI000418E2FD|nr:hypothetical protein [Propionicicella superfundia]
MSESQPPSVEPPPGGEPNRLVNTFEWQRRCVFAGIAFVVLAGILVYQQTYGWLQAVLVLALVLGGYCAWSWWRGQHWAEFTGDRLRIGNGTRTQEIRGADVTAVKYIMNRHSPDFALVTSDKKRHTVRTSRLAKGHSSLFRWLLAHAPQASFDKGSVRTRELLETRGLLP